MSQVTHIIFDCDGVLIDSEIVSNRIEAEFKSELGFPIQIDEQLRRFVGLGSSHPLIQSELARLPNKYKESIKERIWAAFRQELRTIPNVVQAVSDLELPYCIASSSSIEKLEFTLGLTELLPLFQGKLYSATTVKNGKPDPDIYLHVARLLGSNPQQCIAVEDSVVGVQAAKAAGMKVLGFMGASHSYVFNQSDLMNAGTDEIFTKMSDLNSIINRYIR